METWVRAVATLIYPRRCEACYVYHALDQAGKGESSSFC